MFQNVDRQRKYDGRVLLGRDGVERLQVAQLQKINSPSQKWPVKPINIFETNLLKIVFSPEERPAIRQ